MKSSRILLAMVPLVFASQAHAQGTPEQRTACGPEAIRLCASALPDIGKITECMKEKRDSLSTACRTAMDAASAEQQPQTAEAPAPAQAEPAPSVASKAEPDETSKSVAKVETDDAAKPVAKAEADDGAKPAATEATSPQQTASSTSKVRSGSRQDASTTRAKQTRRQVAARHLHGRQRSDTAEAVYWMRRVTGYSGPLDVSVFEGRANSGLASLLR